MIDILFLVEFEGLQQARVLIYDVPSAIKILLTATYKRLPKFTEDVGIHSTLIDKQHKLVLKKLYTLVKSNYLTLYYPNSSPRLKFLMNIASVDSWGKIVISVELGFMFFTRNLMNLVLRTMSRAIAQWNTAEFSEALFR
nr:hypothetical protein [Tanacetum cinerariifolium]